MQIIGLDGKEYVWKPERYHSQRENASSPHIKARNLLHSLFPFYSINEEIPLVGTPTKLFLDLYIHALRLCCEIQGVQHYQFSSFFHGNAQGFKKSKERDRIKREWCELNNIDLVELPDTESEKEWTERIKNR
jgi:hypothetical protein